MYINVCIDTSLTKFYIVSGNKGGLECFPMSDYDEVREYIRTSLETGRSITRTLDIVREIISRLEYDVNEDDLAQIMADVAPESNIEVDDDGRIRAEVLEYDPENPDEYIDSVAQRGWTVAQIAYDVFASEIRHRFPEADEDFVFRISQLLGHIDAACNSYERSGQSLVNVPISVLAEESGRRSTYTRICSSPERGLHIAQEGHTSEGELVTNYTQVAGYYFAHITRIYNWLDETDVRWNMTFNPVGEGDALEYRSLRLERIIDRMKNEPGVFNRSRLPDVVSALVGHICSSGMVTQIEELSATGFSLSSDDRLRYVIHEDFETYMPDTYTQTDVIDATIHLENLLEFFRFGDHVLTMLYFYIISPLAYIRKVYDLESKILLVQGEPHTGKTSCAKFMGYIWGIRTQNSICAGTRLSQARLASQLAETTHAVTYDEIADSWEEVEEMLKLSTTSLRSHARVLPHEGFRVSHLISYASIAAIANYSMDLGAGLKERIIPVEFTAEDIRDDAEVCLFEERVNAGAERLAYLGAYIRDMYIEDWENIKPKLLEHGPYAQINAGQAVLQKVYQQTRGYIPEWLRRDVLVGDDIEIDREDDVAYLQRYLKECFVAEIARVDRSLFHTGGSWLIKMLELAERGYLPSCVLSVTPKYVTLRVSIINDMTNKTGRRITGGAKSLASKIPGARYAVHKDKTCGTSSRVIRIPSEVVDGWFSGDFDID